MDAHKPRVAWVAGGRGGLRIEDIHGNILAGPTWHTRELVDWARDNHILVRPCPVLAAAFNDYPDQT